MTSVVGEGWNTVSASPWVRIRSRITGRSPVNPLIDVGDYTYGAEYIDVHSWGNRQRLRIGKYCSIADRISVFLGGNHRHEWVTTYPFAEHATEEHLIADIEGVQPLSKGDVVIGKDVWVGSHASIMSGVTIGSGAVIAAFAHVVKDVSPYEIVGGNPARHIAFRFDQATIEALQEVAWWDWPLALVLANLDLLRREPDADVLSRMRQLSSRQVSDS